VAPTLSLSAAAIEVVLCDIEGTTTPISFVHDVLFPYARARIPAFLDAHEDDDEVRAIVDALRSEMRSAAGGEQRSGDIVEYLNLLMDADRKSGPLKALQGLIWQEGYATGELRGEVYPDVPNAFARWTSAGVRVAIFSSGSVLAQQLIFGRSMAGDLTGFLSAYFDTRVGAKGEPDSYRRIAETLGVPAIRVLFLSDVVTELAAARGAGLHTLLVVRPPGSIPDASGFDAVTRFDAITV
jgi:enolase-phosphatase E1